MYSSGGAVSDTGSLADWTTSAVRSLTQGAGQYYVQLGDDIETGCDVADAAPRCSLMASSSVLGICIST